MLYSEMSTLAERIAAAPARIPLNRNVGVEVESQGSRRAVARALRGARLAAPESWDGENDVCEYHCDSDDCRNGYLVHPQSDCSITGVEAVIGGGNGTNVSSPRLHKTIEQATKLMRDNGASVNSSCGGHVHVDNDLNYDAARLLIRNTHQLKDEIILLMSAARRDGIRNNGAERISTSLPEWVDCHCFCENCYEQDYDNELGDRGYWFWFTHYGTIEFRGWNGTLRAWRLIMSTYVSAALVQAAKDARLASNGRILDHIDVYLPHYVQMLVLMQFGYQANEPFLASRQEVPVMVSA